MKPIFYLIFMVLGVNVLLAQQPVDWVNPFIGTSNYGAYSSYELEEETVIEIQVGVSYVSIEKSHHELVKAGHLSIWMKK